MAGTCAVRTQRQIGGVVVALLLNTATVNKPIRHEFLFLVRYLFVLAL